MCLISIENLGNITLTIFYENGVDATDADAAEVELVISPTKKVGNCPRTDGMQQICVD